jgi:hypothetical protein
MYWKKRVVGTVPYRMARDLVTVPLPVVSFTPFPASRQITCVDRLMLTSLHYFHCAFSHELNMRQVSYLAGLYLGKMLLIVDMKRQ